MRFRLPAIVLVALGCVVAGCGSPAQAPAPSTSSSTPATVEHGAYGHCLSEHGGTSDEARQDCASLAPGPGPAGP